MAILADAPSTRPEGRAQPALPPQWSDDAPGGPRNFSLMAFYQIVMRTGWIFKTESIVMPAVLDIVAGPAWMRGFLPMLNRFGQSVPPMLASGRVRAAPYKKHSLAICSATMGGAFLLLAVIWLLVPHSVWWMPWAFLLLYGVFFMSTGVNQLVAGTLIGKLIRTHRRGRLMLVADSLGAILAIGCAWLLLGIWLSQERANFFAIFAFSGMCFIACAVICLLLAEPADSFRSRRHGPITIFRQAFRALRRDANFRLLAVVAALFGVSMTLFPHYQALGRERLNLGLQHLMPWVIAQNAGVALFSIPAGWLADRLGYRLVLRLELLVMCTAPLLALWLSRGSGGGGSTYFLVFCFVGLTPVTIRTLSNYTLELALRKDQPKYLGTLSLCIAAPAVLFSPLVGLLLDLAGFELVFFSVVGCLLAGFVLSMPLREPRQAP